MTILESHLARLAATPATAITELMKEWGYTPAMEPELGKDSNQWWAGFISPSGMVNYAWADSPEQAVRQAAKDALGRDKYQL